MRDFRSLSIFLIFAGHAMGAVETKPMIVNVFTHPTRTELGFELPPMQRSSPAAVGDLLYSGNSEGRVTAYHRTDGYVLWDRQMPGKIDGSFAYGRSKIVVGDKKGHLTALHARDGPPSWEFKIQSQWLSPAVLAHSKVFLVSSSDEVYALNEKDGTEVWHYSHKGDEKMTVHGTSAVTEYKNEVFVGFSDGYLAALSADKGVVRWTKKLRTRDRFYDVDMAPYVDDERVIAATFDGNIYSLNRDTGDIQWILKAGSYSGVLVDGETVYFSGLDNHFYSIEKKTGKVNWKTPFEGGVGMRPVRVGDHLIFSTSSDPVYVINPQDGKIIATQRLGAGSFADPVAHVDGTFYCMSNFGNLFAFNILNVLSPGKGPETIPTPSAIQRVVKTDSQPAS